MSQPGDTLVSDFQPPKEEDAEFLLLELPACGTFLELPEETSTRASPSLFQTDMLTGMTQPQLTAVLEGEDKIRGSHCLSGTPHPLPSVLKNLAGKYGACSLPGGESEVQANQLIV